MSTSQADSQAWWTEVEHLRERIERRRAQEVSLAASRARRAAPESDSGSQRRAAHSLPIADQASVAPRRTVHIRGRAAPAVPLPRLVPVEDERVDGLDGEREGVRGGAVRDLGTAPVGGRLPLGAALGSRRRPRASVADRLGNRPDRMAMWAFALALLTVLVALLSAH